MWRYRFTFACAFFTFLPIYVRSAEYSTGRISSGQLAWILRRNDRNESRNEITFHLPRLFIPVDVSLSDSLLPWIDWFIGVSLCKYLFSSPSCFSPSSLPPLFLLVGLSLPLEKKSRWEMIFSFLFFFFLLPFCTRQFRNRADSLCVFECRTRRSSTKDLDLNFHLTSSFLKVIFSDEFFSLNFILEIKKLINHFLLLRYRNTF